MPARARNLTTIAVTCVMTILLCLAQTASAVATRSLEKTASGNFFADPGFYTGEIAPESQQPHWEIDPAPTPTASGRQVWLSPDPIGERGGLNLYGYVDGDPVNSIDQLGLASGILGTITETVGGVLVLGPSGAWDASHGLANEARGFGEWATRRANKNCGGTLPHPGGYNNAARHAYWQGALTHKHGWMNADFIGDFHESGTTDRLDTWIDLYNNNVAQGIGKRTESHRDLMQEILNGLDNGDFITNPDDPRIPEKYRGSGANCEGDSGSGNNSEKHGWNGSNGS